MVNRNLVEMLKLKRAAKLAHANLVESIIENPWCIWSREYPKLVAQEKKKLAKFADEFQYQMKLSQLQNGVK